MKGSVVVFNSLCLILSFSSSFLLGSPEPPLTHDLIRVEN